MQLAISGVYVKAAQALARHSTVTVRVMRGTRNCPEVKDGGLIVRVREVAERLEISPSLVYQLIAAGKLRCTRHGLGRGTVRVSEEQLAEYLAGVTGKPVREKLKHLRLP